MTLSKTYARSSRRRTPALLVAGLAAAGAIAGCACSTHSATCAQPAPTHAHRSPADVSSAAAWSVAMRPNDAHAPARATGAAPGAITPTRTQNSANAHPEAHAAAGAPAMTDVQSYAHLASFDADGVDNLLQVSFAMDGADFDPGVSPDGRWLVFSSTQHSPRADIYIKSVQGRTVSKLTSDGSNNVMPSFSPDGQRIAFASDRNGWWDIYVMGVGGGQPIQITSDRSHQLHPTWSPDGRRIAFSRLNPVSARWELWVVDVVNHGVSRFIGHGMLPAWNPINDKIAFQRPRERGARLFSVWTIDYIDGEGRNPTEIVSDPGVAYINPTWSPDGTRLVFAAVSEHESADPYDARPGASEIWMVRVDGMEKTRLAGAPFVNLMPTWGADGRVYFVSDRGGPDNIWAISPSRAILTAGVNETINFAGASRPTPATASNITADRPRDTRSTKAPMLGDILGAIAGAKSDEQSDD